MNDLSKEEIQKVLDYISPEQVEHREKVQELIEAGELDEDPGIEIPIEDVIQHLPDSMALAIISVNQRTQLPLELCLQTALAAANLVAQPHYNVDPLLFGSTALTDYFVVLQNRSGGKTTAMREFFGVIEECYGLKHQSFEMDKAKYDFDMIEYKKEMKAGNPVAKPQHPADYRPIVQNPTLNGLIVKMENCRSLGIVTDEGTKFINSYDNRGGSSNISLAASLCSLWGGGTVERITGMDQTYISNRRCNLFLMVQKAEAAKLVSNERYNKQGLESRLLIIDSDNWMRPLAPTGGNKKDMDGYNNRIRDLYMKDPNVSQWDHMQLEPFILHWDDAAKQDAIATCYSLNGEINKMDDDNPSYADGIKSKGYEHMCKIAGTLCVYDGRDTISMTDWTAAKTLFSYYAQQRIKIGTVVDPDKIGDMAKAEDDILKWLSKQTQNGIKNCSYISILDARGPVSYRKYLEPTKREALLDSMVRRGLLIHEDKLVKLDPNYKPSK